MRLRELQRELQCDLLGNESSIAEAIVEAPPLSVDARLGIYRNAYRARLIEALDDVYPMLHRMLGDEEFESLGRSFVETHPSGHRSIRWYGREIADFIGTASLFADRPILAEIARFEWTLAEVFDAADAKVLDRSALQAVDLERWGALSFKFHPSVRRLAFAWNTVAVWQAASEQRDAVAPLRSPDPVPWLLWRRDYKNYFRSLDAVEDTALTAAIAGSHFTEICESLAAHLPEEEIPLRAATLTAAWLDSGIIESLST
jgi:hypothetical protein